ncbi:MAG: LysE family translocator [Alphaproteobacteria bacterium]|nr:LysE family translocator [Alphaproteobacteria bacterium]
MAFDLWLAFAAASAVVLMIPGPTILLVVGYALGEGKRAAMTCSAGVVLGDFVAITLSFVGVGALIAASADAFTALKWAGAAYLVYLGIKMWRATPHLDAAEARTVTSHRTMFTRSFVVTMLNPKSIAFFIAFMPQFIDPAAALLPQATAMTATFLVLAFANALFYAFLAGTARQQIRRPAVLRAVNRVGGTVLIGAGIMTAALKRA